MLENWSKKPGASGSHLSSQAIWNTEIGNMMDPGKPGQKARSYLQNNQSKKVGSVGSSTCLANTKSLEFKPQYCQKKNWPMLENFFQSSWINLSAIQNSSLSLFSSTF
jgi:hypothetical protein